MVNLTFIMENYLEAVYELSKGGTGARVTDIAVRLGVSKASVNNAMSVLAEKGLVESEKYQEIRLTRSGEEQAALISGKHRVIQQYLIEVLGVDPSVADTDACAIEHVISSDSVYAMQKHLAEHCQVKRSCQ
jgi:Mn-dependent DtxR family transcriptional regulator